MAGMRQLGRNFVFKMAASWASAARLSGGGAGAGAGAGGTRLLSTSGSNFAAGARRRPSFSSRASFATGGTPSRIRLFCTEENVSRQEAAPSLWTEIKELTVWDYVYMSFASMLVGLSICAGIDFYNFMKRRLLKKA
ncbi:hypothetical protein ACH5RR_030593 [Cinchona calisaya]|uniref:Uncharacterized protein n=1 Tax=Cinchona calisaya TaxID=153742 RepID=A0ABD2YY97_9GENT